MKRLLIISLLFLLSLTACGGGGFDKYTSQDAIDAFQAAGLEAENPTAIDPNEDNPVPKTFVEGQRFLIPSMGEDRGGRVFSFASEGELAQLRDYYEGFSGMLGSWVSVKDNLVLQVSVDLPREQWLEYEAVFQGLE